jgi:hypothetical protein
MMRFTVELQRELIPGEVLALNFGHYETVKHYETVYEEVLYRKYFAYGGTYAHTSEAA